LTLYHTRGYANKRPAGPQLEPERRDLSQVHTQNVVFGVN